MHIDVVHVCTRYVHIQIVRALHDIDIALLSLIFVKWKLLSYVLALRLYRILIAWSKVAMSLMHEYFRGIHFHFIWESKETFHCHVIHNLNTAKMYIPVHVHVCTFSLYMYVDLFTLPHLVHVILLSYNSPDKSTECFSRKKRVLLVHNKKISRSIVDTYILFNVFALTRISRSGLAIEKIRP